MDKKPSMTLEEIRAVNDKLSKAIIKFFDQYPLYYIILSSLARIGTSAISTIGVGFDSQNIISLFYNPDFIGKLDTNELQIVLNHECQHLGLRHLDRGKSQKYHENKKLANVAMDIVINDAIADFISSAPNLYKKAMTADKFESLQGVVIRDKTWEQLFEIIKEEVDKQKSKMEQLFKDAMDSHDKWNGEDGQQSDLSPEQQMALDGLMKDAVKNLGNRDPGNVPGAMRRMVEEIRKVFFNWRRELSIFAQIVAQEDRIPTWKKINRRLGTISPGNKKEFKPNILLVVDNSGSIDGPIYDLFMSHMLKISETCNRIDGIGVDTKVNCEFKLEKGKTPNLKDLLSGGGTNFQPAFDYAKKKGDYSGIVYFTDGYNFDSFITHSIPVIFAICAGGKEVMGYRNIRIEDDESI